MKPKRTTSTIAALAPLASFTLQPSRRRRLALRAAIMLLSLGFGGQATFGQGSLTPPGAPAPTMKTLAQIEPRTAIASAPFTISVPGSYYLTTNLTVSTGNAIVIATNGVTLDLNGYVIHSTAATATGAGIRINGGLRNIAIANGFIQGGVTNDGSGVYSGGGFASGITFISPAPANVLVSRVSVSGCLHDGIRLGVGDSTVVENCTVRTVGGAGIFASIIKTSSAIDCGGTAIFGDQVSDCRGEATGSGTGVFANTAQNCYGSSSSGYGVHADTAQNCYGSSNSGQGVFANTAQNCYGTTNSGFGVLANTAQNCYGSSNSGDGVRADTAQTCYGLSNSGFGIFAAHIAIGCHGASSTGTAGLFALNAVFCTGRRPGGTAILATIANGCLATSGTINATHRYNMP